MARRAPPRFTRRSHGDLSLVGGTCGISYGIGCGRCGALQVGNADFCPKKLVAFPSLFQACRVSGAEADVDIAREDVAGKSRLPRPRILIIQEKGRHAANAEFRESLCVQRAFARLGVDSTIWGLRQDNFHIPYEEIEKSRACSTSRGWRGAYISHGG